MTFPLKFKQEKYNRDNDGTVNFVKEVGWLNKLIILSSRDKFVCNECSENDGKLVDAEIATIPPVLNCQNLICRCIYMPKEE